jgi:hypothetical protein
MFSLDDQRWPRLAGGYRLPFDPRLLFARLEANTDTKSAWHELWENLHHQGDVGEASYAAIPHLVRIYRKLGTIDWNTYAIVGVIELARTSGNNPEVPEWLKEDYFKAIRELAEVGAVEVLRAKSPEESLSMLSILATAVGARTHARFLLDYSDEEMLEMDFKTG